MQQRVQIALIVFLALACVAAGLWGYRNERAAASANKDREATDYHLIVLEHAGVSETGCRERGGEISHRPFGSAFCTSGNDAV